MMLMLWLNIKYELYGGLQSSHFHFISRDFYHIMAPTIRIVKTHRIYYTSVIIAYIAYWYISILI